MLILSRPQKADREYHCPNHIEETFDLAKYPSLQQSNWTSTIFHDLLI